MTERRRATKAVAGAGVLAALVLSIGGVVSAELRSGDDAAEQEAAAVEQTRTTSAAMPLVNTALDSGDIVRLTPASRSIERDALADGEGVTFSVTVDGATFNVTSTADTLADALAEAGVALGWDDQVSADLSAAPEEGAAIAISRGTTQYVTEQVVTPHASETRNTSSLLVGETRVVQEGVDGDQRVSSSVQYVDGVEVSRSTVLTTQLTAPVTEIVEVGTRKPVVAAAPAASNNSGGGTTTTEEAPSTGGASSTSAEYTLAAFKRAGVVNWGGYKFTYYSQSVLPGGGLSIPGRHINADGYVSDGDGYIVLASSAPKGSVINTPFGYQGKVYDRGTVGNHYDVYIR